MSSYTTAWKEGGSWSWEGGSWSWEGASCDHSGCSWSWEGSSPLCNAPVLGSPAAFAPMTFEVAKVVAHEIISSNLEGTC